MKRNSELIAGISFLTVRFLKDFVQLYYLTIEFLEEIKCILNLIEPLYNVLNSRLDTKLKNKVPLDLSQNLKNMEPSKHKANCSSCGDEM